jgi:hypothetical protein
MIAGILVDRFNKGRTGAGPQRQRDGAAPVTHESCCSSRVVPYGHASEPTEIPVVKKLLTLGAAALVLLAALVPAAALA